MMRLMARVMPPSRDVARLVSDGMDHRLSWRQRLTIRMHVTLCALCRRYERQLHLLRKAEDIRAPHKVRPWLFTTLYREFLRGRAPRCGVGVGVLSSGLGIRPVSPTLRLQCAPNPSRGSFLDLLPLLARGRWGQGQCCQCHLLLPRLDQEGYFPL